MPDKTHANEEPALVNAEAGIQITPNAIPAKACPHDLYGDQSAEVLTKAEALAKTESGGGNPALHLLFRTPAVREGTRTVHLLIRRNGMHLPFILQQEYYN